MYIIYVNTHITDRDIIMKNETNRKNRIDDLEKEIKDLKERVKMIEGYLKGKRAEEKPSTMFM